MPEKKRLERKKAEIDIKPAITEDKIEILRSNLMNIKVIVEKGEDGYFVASVPSLKGCWSQGKTRDEALTNIREAIDLYLEPEPFELEKNKELVELAI